jgi:hypothetical protein
MSQAPGHDRPVRLHPYRVSASAVDVAKAALGIWLFVSPGALESDVTGHHLSSAAVVNFLAVGGALLLGGVVLATSTSATASLIAPKRHGQWAWVTLILAVWLLVTPWVLGYSDQRPLTLNAVIVAVALAGLSALNLVATRKLGHEQHSGFVRETPHAGLTREKATDQPER